LAHGEGGLSIPTSFGVEVEAEVEAEDEAELSSISIFGVSGFDSSTLVPTSPSFVSLFEII